MTAVPGAVEVRLAAPPARSRGQVALRALAGPAIGQFGPLGLLAFPLAYLVVPLIAAFHLRVDGPDAFLRDEVPRLAQGLGWILALHAWASCLVDRFPLPDERSVLTLELRPASPPTPAAALGALVRSAPRGAALFAACLATVPVWIAAMASLAVAGRLPAALSAPLRRLLDAQAAFLARHASLTRPARPPRRATGRARPVGSMPGP